MMNKCMYCGKEMTDKEMNKKFRGVGIERFEDGGISCSTCMFERVTGN